jgi:hydroxymethylpyrimidine kinase/phosphomethylpyrimidine kinase
MTAVALTIAGSDSSGGAGIQADLKTFAAFAVFGTTAITAITAQNTRGVSAIVNLDPALVAAQIDAVADDFTIAAAKTGMLSRAEIISAVADRIRIRKIPNVVVDPVMVAASDDVNPGAYRHQQQRSMRDRKSQVYPPQPIESKGHSRASVIVGVIESIGRLAPTRDFRDTYARRDKA